MKSKTRRASIYHRKSDGLWVSMIVTGYNPDTKKPRRKAVYGKSKQEVQEKLRELMNKRAEGLLDQSAMTL